MQKNVITNEFEVIKKYKRDIPRNIVSKDIKEFLQNVDQEEELNPLDMLVKVLMGDTMQEFMQNCLNVVYETKNLWEAIRKAEEIRDLYYKNNVLGVKFKKCLHHEPALAPLCLL